MERIKSRREKKNGYFQVQRRTIKERDLCFECKKEFDKSQLEVEHEIPVSVGGDLAIFRLFCEDCHKKKTIIDNQIIAFFKKMGFLIKIVRDEYETPLQKEMLVNLYKEIYNEAKRISYVS